MLSAKVLKLILKLAKFAYRLGSIPFVWDTTNHKLCVTKSKLKLFHWKCIFLFFCCNSMFMSVRLVQAFCCIPGVSYGKLFINFFSFVTFTTNAAVHLNTFLFLNEIPKLFNEMVRVNEYFERNLKTLERITKVDDSKFTKKLMKKQSTTTTSKKVSPELNDPQYQQDNQILKEEFSIDEGNIKESDISITRNFTFRNYFTQFISNFIKPDSSSSKVSKDLNDDDTSSLFVEESTQHHLHTHRQSLVKSAMGHLRHFGLHKHHEPQPGDSTATFMHRIIFPIYCYSLSQFFIVFRAIDNPKYIYSLFNFKSTPKWKLIPFAAFECYVSFSAASTMLFYIIFMLTYVKSTKWCLKRLLTLKNHNHIPKYYRTLQVLNVLCNHVLRTILMPALIMTTMVIILVGNYATLKLFHEVKMPAFLGFPTVSIAMMIIAVEGFPTSYQINEYSERILNLLKADFQRNRFSIRKGFLWKFVRSCKPLEMEVSVFFVMKRITTITYFGIACNYTFQLLVM